jgi:hypothetical protein
MPGTDTVARTLPSYWLHVYTCMYYQVKIEYNNS